MMDEGLYKVAMGEDFAVAPKPGTFDLKVINLLDLIPHHPSQREEGRGEERMG